MVQIPDIIDNAYVIVEFENGSRGMLDLCMFAEGSKNEQEIAVVGDIGKVEFSPQNVSCIIFQPSAASFVIFPFISMAEYVGGSMFFLILNLIHTKSLYTG